MFNNPILKHMCRSYVRSRSLSLTFVNLDLNSLQHPQPPLFFVNWSVVNQFLWFVLVVSSFKNSGDMQLKKPPQTFSSKAICYTFHFTWKSEAMAAEADVEDFCWEGFVWFSVCQWCCRWARAILILELLVGVVQCSNSEVWTVWMNNFQQYAWLYNCGHVRVHQQVLCLLDID